MAQTNQLYAASPNYTRLRKGDIRIIRLHPGKGDANESPIVFSLKHVSLDNPPPYNAISYVWGEATDREPILLEHRWDDSSASERIEVLVTRNLRDALQHFRHPTSPKILWADALCINQQDIAERADQVRLMQDIYTKAEMVQVWLGLEDLDTQSAVEFFSNVADICTQKMPMSEWVKVNYVGTVAELLGVSHLPVLDEHGVSAALRIYARPWFYRIWVIQEASAGRQVNVSIGPYTIPFSSLGIASMWLRELQFVATGSGAGSEGMRNASMMWQQRFALKEDPANLLDDGKDFGATDPRDKVYAMLGFPALRNVLSNLEPDYGKSVEEVYTEVAIAIIKETRSLDVMAFAELPPVMEFREAASAATQDCLPWPATPTWVARWDEQTYFPTSSMCTLPMYANEPADRAAAVTFMDARKGIIRLQGLWIDDIVWIAPVLGLPQSPDADPILENPETLVEIWKSVWARLEGKVEKDVAFTALAHTITGGTAADYQSTAIQSENHVASFAAYTLVAVQSKESDQHKDMDLMNELELFRKHGLHTSVEDQDKFFLAMNLMASCRRVFITRKGHLGLGHSQVLVGDELAMLHGAKLPFVLRPQEGFWQLVGESYVHNVMDGRVHERWSGCGLREQNFELR